MTSQHDISRANSVQQKAYHLITTTHNGQKERRLIRISHQKTMHPNATNVTRTSHNGKKPRQLLRKYPLVTKLCSKTHVMISSRNIIRAQQAGNLSRNSHYGTQKTSNLIRQLSSTTQHKVIRKSHNHPKAWSLMRKISWHFITAKKHKSLYGNPHYGSTKSDIN